MNEASILLGYVNEVDKKTSLHKPVYLDLKKANRHGLIAGATGTGKTVTLQMFAESFSQQGVPVFLADVKGDLSGISQAGKPHKKIIERFEILNLPLDAWQGNPTIFWDVYGKSGHPIRATVSDLGPLLLARLLNLNDVQEGILHIAFAVADDQGLLLLDLKDLRSMLQFLADNAKDLRSTYGNVSGNSVGAIQRRLLTMQRGSAKKFFGEPMLDLDDLMRVNENGVGMINVLASNKLILEPAVYAVTLLWILSELFENLPEVGDPKKPKLILFFDEAHLMFRDTPKVLVDKVEQVVRLIRSKGIGVFFVTQSPSDIPDSVLAQLANRVQHALRAFTPKEQKSVRVVANTFRSDGSFSVKAAITELGIGEALVSTLMKNGAPSFVRRVKIKPPFSRIGPATLKERKEVISRSPVANQYDDPIDRESAFELLAKRADDAAKAAEKAERSMLNRHSSDTVTPAKRKSNRQGLGEVFLKSIARSLGGRTGRSLIRGILGSLFKGR